MVHAYVISKNFIAVFSSFLLLFFIKITNCCLETNHQFSKLFQFMPWKNGCDLMSSAPFKPLPSRSRGLKHNSWNVIREFIKIKLLFSMLLWKCTCFFFSRLCTFLMFDILVFMRSQRIRFHNTCQRAPFSKTYLDCMCVILYSLQGYFHPSSIASGLASSWIRTHRVVF